jgi:hypothetical protein
MNKNVKNLLWTAGGVLLAMAVNKLIGLSSKVPEIV